MKRVICRANSSGEKSRRCGSGAESSSTQNDGMTSTYFSTTHTAPRPTPLVTGAGASPSRECVFFPSPSSSRMNDGGASTACSILVRQTCSIRYLSALIRRR